VQAQLRHFQEAREDARTCINLRSTWPKGWVRLGHALCGLEEWTEAKSAFARARELEPDDQAIEKAWQKV
jgi:stress-induced-phosphoprotein 1